MNEETYAWGLLNQVMTENKELARELKKLNRRNRLLKVAMVAATALVVTTTSYKNQK